MRGERYVDIGSVLDEVFEAAKTFSEEMKNGLGHDFGCKFEHPGSSRFWKDENADWYPSFSYPPMNIFLTAERAMTFEFALAGFEESDINLSFQGDYMVFSATIGNDTAAPDDSVRYFKRRLKLKDIEKQKYYVPAEKFDQSAVKALFKNGILRVTVPPKEESEVPEGIKIEIAKEGD